MPLVPSEGTFSPSDSKNHGDCRNDTTASFACQPISRLDMADTKQAADHIPPGHQACNEFSLPVFSSG